MKKIYLLLASVFIAGLANAQLTGTKNIPGDYATLAAAITDLNLQGVGTGGVILNVLPGNPQTAPAGGYVIGGTGSNILITGTFPTSLTNNVQIQGNGNAIVASPAHTAGSLTDAVFKLIGADYIGIQGCLIQENPANTVNVVASNTMTEFGIALFYVSLTDGCQNNAFASNAISLNRTYLNTFGIYSNTRHSSTSVTVAAEVTSAGGSNSFNRVYGNTISNVNYGIVFIGAGTTIAAIDNGNDIGGTSSTTGNTITNWGGGAAASGYLSLTGNNYCIFSNQQINDNISFNTITSAALTSAVTEGGILKNYSIAQPVGTITTTINNNTVTVTNNPTAATTGSIIGINNQGLTPLLATATMSINNNTVQNCVLGGSTSTTNGISCITNLSLPGTINMNGNSVINNAITATTATSAVINGISNSGAAGTLNINNNIIRGHASTATTGQPQGITNSGAVVTAININSNQLGNASGGFFSTSTATSGTLFGISNSAGAGTCVLSIQSNDIRGITYSSLATAAQTYIINSAATLSQNISSNTFTNLNVNTGGAATFISNSVTLSATGTQTVNNNSIVTGFTKPGTGTVTLFTSNASSAAGAVITQTGNNFSNINLTGAASIAGWSNTDGGSPTKTITGNTFSNWTTLGAAITVLNVNFNGNNTSVSNNTISTITGQAAISGIVIGSSATSTQVTVANNTLSGLTSTGTGGAVVGISCSSAATVVNLNNNAISTLASTAAAAVTGISIGGATTTNVFANKVCDVAGSNASSTVNGILVSSGATVNLYNNLIGDLRTPAANAANPLNGLNITGGTTVNAHFNRVRIAATSSGALFGSSAVSVSTTPTVTLRDNIFVNLSTTNGAAFTAAHRRSSTTLTTYAAASNNNLFFAGTPGATNVIYFDGTNNDQTLSAYKARVSSRDNLSVTENAPFLSTTCSNANFLHIDPSIATQVEGGGIPITGITVDFDGNTRNVTTPDIGADEGTFTPQDLSAPSISYTPLTFTCATGDRTLTATITDFTGVPTTGALQPRIYFRKNAGTWFSTQGVLSSGTGTNGTWTFTIVAATMGGLVLADNVQYNVIAQDIVTPTANIGANPGSGLVATDVNTVTTAPTTPNSYTINNTLSGTYTVGAAGVYPTLTAAVNAYNTSCLSGPVLFSLIDASYPGETFPISVNANASASNVNTLTIKPTLANTVISGSSTTSIIKLNGANYVIIDGSISNTANSLCPPITAASRDLSITNTSTAAATAAVWLSSLGSGLGATNNVIKNCILSNGVDQSATATDNFGIVSCGSTITAAPSTDGLSNNNNTIENNAIIKCAWGIFLRGGASSSNTANTIRQNQVGPAAFGSNELRKGGIVVQHQDGVTITGNEVRFIGNQLAQTIGGTDHIGIGIGGLDGPSPTTTNVTNGVITQNNVHDIVEEKTFSSIGIVLAVPNTAASNNLIANNMVSNVRSNATLGDQGIGINVANGNGDRIVYNSVSMVTTDRDPSTASTASESDMGVRFQAGALNPLFKDNIIYVDEASNTGTLKNFAVVAPAGTFPWGTGQSNYNDYTINTSGTQNAQFGLGTTGAITQVANIATWRTTFTPNQDANSNEIVPVFVGTTDLHLVPASNIALNNLGNPVTGVTTDYDCDVRSGTTPDMGIDEFSIPACTGTPTPGTAALSPTSVCANQPATLTLTGYTQATGIVLQWQASFLPGGPYTPIPGANAPTYTGVLPSPGTYYITCLVTCTNSEQSAPSNEVSLLVKPVPVVSVTPTTGLFCTPGTGVTLTASATGGTGATTFAWSPTTGLLPTTGSPVVASPTAATVYTVTGTDAGGCSSTATATVNVGSAVSISSVTATPSTICSGNTSALNVAASISTGNYFVSTVPFVPIASGTGTTTLCSGGVPSTPLTAGTLDDGYWNGIAIPFSFNYFGTPYNTIHVGTNGFASFTALATTTGYGSSPQIPNVAAPNNIIGGCFGDLYWTSGGTISTYTTGTTPNRIFVINFNGGTAGGFYNGGSAPVAFTTFQIQLFETSNLIQVHTTSITADASTLHTMGIENTGGTVGFVAPGRNNSLWSLTNNGTQFAPPGTFTYAWAPSTGLTPSATIAAPTTPTLTTTTPYSVTVTDISGCSATGSTTVTVNPTLVPSVSIAAAPGTTICAGTSVTFTATPVNPGAGPIYQWKKNGSNVGTNSTTYTDATLLNGDLITCDMTSNATCAAPTLVTSNTLTMTVNPTVVFGQHQR